MSRCFTDPKGILFSMNARLWSCLVGGLFAVPAWSDPGTFHQVEVISSAEPVAEYARMAETGHKLCNISLTAMGVGPRYRFRPCRRRWWWSVSGPSVTAATL